MRQLVVAIALATVACSPLYGAKPEKLAKPQPKKRPPEEKVAAPEVKYVEDCNASFRDDPKTAKTEKAIADRLANDGDAAMDVGKKAKEPAGQASGYKEAIDKYGNALKKAPFDATITLKLALAYDAVYRKGCAIALLKRLESLSKNPKVSPDANRIIDSIGDQPTWFKGYRKDAIAAIGR